MENMINIREVGKEVSERTYYNLIGAFLSYGFIVNIIMVATLGTFARSINSALFIVGYFISCFLGCVIMNKYDNALLGFIGYNMIVVPIGLLLAMALPDYNLNDIAFAFFTTLIVTIGMIVVSNIKPAFFRDLGSGLLVSLTLLIVVEVILALFGLFPGWIDVIACGIFCLYIGYDWVRAGENYKSVSTAILISADLYLDIINLFISILNIKSSSDD